MAVGLWNSVTIEITRAKMLAPRIKRELMGRALDTKRAAAIDASLALPTLRNDARMGFIKDTVDAPFFIVLFSLGLSVLMLCAGECVRLSVCGVLVSSIMR